MKHTGFQFNINCNQIGAHRAGVQDGIDLIDLAIMDVIIQYSTWEGCKKQTHNGKNYFHFPWRVLPQRAPMIGLNSRSPVKTRIQKLCTVGLLIPHPENQTTGESWFCFGPKYGLFHNFTPVLENNNPSSEQDTPQSSEQDTPVLPKGHNEYTYNESNNSEREARPPEPKPQKEEKLVIAQEIENLIKANPQVSPAELKVFVLKEAIKRHFEKYPLNRDLYTTGLTPVPTAREFLEQIDIYVRHYSAESVPGYQFFVNDPVGHIPKTFPKWLRRWATGKRDELRQSGATSGVYEKPKI